MNYLAPISFSILLGATMKFADLHNEHGLVLFKGSQILFGILWGLSGVILIFTSSLLANLYISLILSYIVRGKIDYPNHGIATGMIFLSFIYRLNLSEISIKWQEVVYFFVMFVITGLIHDFLVKITPNTKGLTTELMHTGFAYFLFPLCYSFYSCEFVPFYNLSAFAIAYEGTRFLGNKLLIKK